VSVEWLPKLSRLTKTGRSIRRVSSPRTPLIALAVDLVGTDDPSVFATQIPALTTRGRVCRSFEECQRLLDESLNINYNGPDGITELLVVGHPARARFDVFAFDETGRGVFEQSIVASRL
jgi:hypothetical protein